MTQPYKVVVNRSLFLKLPNTFTNENQQLFWHKGSLFWPPSGKAVLNNYVSVSEHES